MKRLFVNATDNYIDGNDQSQPSKLRRENPWVCESPIFGPVCRQLSIGEDVKGKLLYRDRADCISRSPCSATRAGFSSISRFLDAKDMTLLRGVNMSSLAESKRIFPESRETIQQLVDSLVARPRSNETREPFDGKNFDQRTINAVLDRVFERPHAVSDWVIEWISKNPYARQWIMSEPTYKDFPASQWVSWYMGSPRFNAFFELLQHRKQGTARKLFEDIMEKSAIDSPRWSMVFQAMLPGYIFDMSWLTPFLSDPAVLSRAMKRVIDSGEPRHVKTMMDLVEDSSP